MTATPAFVEWSLENARRISWPDCKVPRLGTRLALGAGEVSPDGWLCLDLDESYPDLDVDQALASGEGRYRCDVRSLDWIPRRSCAAVYAHHVIEHLPVSDFVPTLRAWAELVAPGGFLYLCQPDLEAIAARTLEAAQPGSAAGWFDRDPLHRTWIDDTRQGLALTGYKAGSAWFWLYFGGDHLAVPAEAQVRAALSETGLELRRARKVLSKVPEQFRLFVALEACYIGRRPPE